MSVTTKRKKITLHFSMPCSHVQHFDYAEHERIEPNLVSGFRWTSVTKREFSSGYQTKFVRE